MVRLAEKRKKSIFLNLRTLLFMFLVMSVVIKEQVYADMTLDSGFNEKVSIRASFINSGSILNKLLVQKRNTTNFISSVGDLRPQDLSSTWKQSFSKIKDLYVVEAPRANKSMSSLKTHLNEQVRFYNYKENRPAVIMLTVLTTNSALNWIIFGGSTPEATKATIIMVNAILYAYVGVNVPNWRRLLGFANNQLLRFKTLRNASSDLTRFLSSSATNFSYYFAYNYAIQGILNFDHVERLLGIDVFNLALANSVFGVFSSGFWDPIFEKWVATGKVSEKNMNYLYYGRSLIMGVLSNLAAIGVSDVRMLMAGSGVTASVILLGNSRSAKGLRLKLGRRIQAFLPHRNLGSSGLTCRSVLSN